MFTKSDISNIKDKPNLEDLADCAEIQKIELGTMSELVKHDFELAKNYNICSQRHQNLKNWITKQK
jgi:hypothetical protein